MKGVNVLYVSKQMGHKSVDITLSGYARWIPSDDRKEVDRLDNCTAGNQTKPMRNLGFAE